jgi:parallel beta-helix repeat protein
MAERRVEVRDGWAGIAAALAAAHPGETVRLSSGRYEGDATLRVPSGVTLAGEDGVQLVFTGEEIAILAEDAQDVTLRDFALEGYGQFPAEIDEPDPDEVFTNGLVAVRRCRALILEALHVRAHARRRSCLAATDSAAVTVRACTTRGGRRGVAFWGSQGVVEKCTANKACNGMVLATGSGATPSKARLIANTCHENSGDGITLFSSESEAVEGNTCWGNGDSGIVLQRDGNSPDAPSRARLIANTCHENTGAGIALFSSESEAVGGNTCWGNGGSGIVLQRDGNSPDAPSRARLIANTCHENQWAGIDLFSSESEAVEGNTCWGNGTSGIALERDPRSRDAPSRARLIANTCHENQWAGIILSSSESEAVEGNTCWGNGTSGIALQRDPRSPDAPSRARLIANTCHQNSDYGIALFSSESEAVKGNTCWGNGTSGVALGRDPVSRDAPSRARLIANTCHENQWAGIDLFSSESEAVEGNTCWGNGTSGIALQRHDKSRDAPSRARLIANTCHENTGAGIVLFSSESEAVEGNTCWGNGTGGIALERDPRSPAAPSRAKLYANSLQANRQAGIAVLASTGTAADNRLHGNGRELYHEPAPDVADPEMARNTRDLSLNLPGQADDGLTAALRVALGAQADDALPGRVAAFVAHGGGDGFDALVDHAQPLRGPNPIAGHTDDALWRAVWDKGARTTQRTRQKGGPATLARQFARMAQNAADRGESGLAWAALIAPDEATLHALRAAVDAAREAHNTRQRDRPPGLIAPLVMIDHSPGEGADAAGRPVDPLEDAALAGAGKTGQRIGCLARSVWFWLALAFAAVIIWWWGAELVATPTPQTVRAWVEVLSPIVVAAPMAAAAGASFVNLLLPDILTLRFPLVPDWVGQFLSAVFNIRTKQLEIKSDAWLLKVKRRVSVDWVRRRLFSRGDVVMLVIRHVEGWSQEEILRLKALAGELETSQGLFVVLQLDDRAYLRPAVFDLADDVRPWAKDIDLHFEDDRARVSLSGPEPVEEIAFDILLGGRNKDFAQKVRASMLLTNWASIELPAALPIGSAPTARFSIRRPAAAIPEQDGPLLQDIKRYAGFFAETPVEPSPDTLNRAFETAARSLALGVRTQEPWTRLWGKVGYRRHVARAVRRVFAEGGQAAAADRYLAGCLAAGLWRCLGDVAQALRQQGSINDPSEQTRLAALAVRGLEGATFLGEEMVALAAPGTETLSRGLAERWAELADALKRPLPLPVGAAIARRFLAARAACRVTPAGVDPWGAQSLLSALDAALAAPTAVADTSPLREALIHDLAAMVAWLRQMDHQKAADALARLQRQEWLGLPTDLVDGVRARATNPATQTIVALLAEAPTLAALERVVRLHARQPQRVLYAIALLACEHVWPKAGRRFAPHPVDPPVDALVKIALFVREVAARRDIAFETVPRVKLQPSGLEVSGLSPSLHDLHRLLARHRDGLALGGVAALLAEPAPANIMGSWLAIEPAPPPLDRVEDLELERVLALTERRA